VSRHFDAIIIGTGQAVPSLAARFAAAGMAVDIIALMDALRIGKAIIGGFDWGARTANAIAALWPERCKALVAVSGDLIGNPESNKMPLPPKAELEWWYQFYFATKRGRAGYENTGSQYKLVVRTGKSL
jgi:pimeloyl-ACP methyl ester carboxylesterase